MLNIGIIGLGPDWETLYLPALRQLSGRLRVTAVYDAVAARGVQAADLLRAWPMTGVRALINRADVKAVLILDTGWHGPAPLEFAIEYEKPALVALPFEFDMLELESLHRRATSAGRLLVPGLPLRFYPAALRLRELIATQLGPAIRMDVRVSGNAAFNTSLLAAIIDWCSQVAQAIVVHVGPAQATPQTSDAATITVTLRRSQQSAAPLPVEIRSVEPSANADADSHSVHAPLHIRIECAGGHAEILSPQQIRWQSARQQADEVLARERPGIEVMLDSFARRAVGGLIPVPDLGDVCRVLRSLNEEGPASERTA